MHIRTESLKWIPAVHLFAFLLVTPSISVGEDVCGAAISQMEETIESWVSAGAEPLAPSVIYRLDGPDGVLQKENAFGLLASDGQPASARTPYFIASMSKTMVAAVVLKITERENISLDTSLGRLVAFSKDMLDQMHIFEEQSFGSQITIRQLLNHSSGLKDYLLDDRNGTGAKSENGFMPGSLIGTWFTQLGEYARCVSKSTDCPVGTDTRSLYPGRQWAHWNRQAWLDDPDNREAGLMNFYLAEMAGSALFEPGSARHYSDTNYLILGLIIEHLTGKRLGEALLTELFQPLGMDNSWLSYSGVDPLAGVQQAADFDAGGFMLLSLNANMSWDWGGGGVVSTARDQTVFMRALIQGQIFTKPETVNALKQLIPTQEDEEGVARGYGLGVGYTRDSEAGELWGHSGAWGSIMLYAPVHDMAMAATVNRALASDMQNQLTQYLAAAASACSNQRNVQPKSTIIPQNTKAQEVIGESNY